MSSTRNLPDGSGNEELARKLDREQALTQEVLDSLEEVYYVFTAAGEILRWNQRVGEVTGYSDAEITDMHPADFVPEGQRELIREKIAQVLEEGRVRFEASFLTKEGREIPYEFTGSLLEVGGDRLICGIGRDITEQKRTEQALRAFQDRFSDALNELPIYVYNCDDRLRYTWISNTLADLPPEEAVGQVVGAVLPGPEATRLQEIHRQVLETGEGRRAEFQISWDGQSRYFQAFLAPQVNEAGRVAGLTGAAVDITARKQAEERLRRSEAKYRKIFENSQDGIAVTLPDGTKELNPAGQEISGLTEQELNELDVEEIVLDMDKREERLAQLDEQGFARGIETRVNLGGQERVFQLTSSRWQLEEEGGAGRITIFRDVTEQKRREQALRESEEKFRTLAERTLIGVVLIQDGSYQYVNPRFAEILGYRPEEIVGRPAQGIAHPGDQAKVRENVRKRLEGEREAIRYSFRARRKDGQIVYLEVYGARIEYQGRPAIIGSALDVTEQRRLQREVLQVQEAERRQMGRDLHDWIASQLTGVSMMLRGLIGEAEEGAPVDPEELEEVGRLVRESVSDARRLARGLNPAKLKQEGLPVALKNLAQMTDRRAEATCQYRQEEALETLSEEMAAHLYWIAQEAAANAAGHAEATQITIRLNAEDEHLELTVEDDGQGFEADGHHEGLGLRSMEYRAELIGGRFNIHSNEGEGTRVVCRVPVEREG